MIQPFVMGATLSLNPLVVLVVTIGAGALFGMVGLTLAAPLTSAAVHIANELPERTARREAEPAPSGCQRRAPVAGARAQSAASSPEKNSSAVRVLVCCSPERSMPCSLR